MSSQHDSAEHGDAFAGSNSDVIATLVASRQRFLEFVERRVGDRAAAGEILQDAFVRGIERADTVRSSESAVAWFFRVLRNAIVDHRRRAASPIRSAGEFAVEPEDSVEEKAEACRCILALTETLKPDYADALRRVDVDGVPVQDFAAEAGISANNASVRLFRAREALKQRVEATCRTCARHGCLDCTCASSQE